MGPTIEEFWKLIVDSQLLSVEDAAQLGSEFGQVKGAIAQANSGTLCEWLVSQEKLTRYQAKILLAGRPGPFVPLFLRHLRRLDGGRRGPPRS